MAPPRGMKGVTLPFVDAGLIVVVEPFNVEGLGETTL